MTDLKQQQTAQVAVRFYDGQTSRAHAGVVHIGSDASVLLLQSDTGAWTFNLIEGRLRPAIGQTPPSLEFPNEVRIEFLDMVLPEWLGAVGQHHPALARLNQLWLHNIWRWERSLVWILASIVITLLLGLVIVRYGIPAFATQTAYALPEHTLDNLGKQALAQLDEGVLKPSNLPIPRQNQIRAEYDQWIKVTPSQNIVFRHGGLFGANAFALPDGTIVLTDELVQLSKQDLEIMAVLAHETGHIMHRHALRQAITGASLSVLMIAVTGDSSDLLSSIPSALIGMSYSRHFEREADDYAYHIMQQHNIPLHYFSDILTRLETEDAKKSKLSKTELGNSNIGDYMSTHPPTAERIARFQGGR